jgi:hypothetical protein
MQFLLPQVNQFFSLEGLGDIDLCKYAMNIEGLLTKSTKYYIETSDDALRAGLSRKGEDIVKRITLNTNTSLSAPLIDQIKQIGFLRIFLSSSMSTVVFFLCILSVQLIYSLMISDVEEKTY